MDIENKEVKRTKKASAAIEENSTEKTTATSEEKVPKAKEYRVKKALDPHMIVPVKSGYNGTLVYKSNKTGETFKWNEFGGEQDMELSELKNAKNTKKVFFENNWFLIDDPEVIEWLGVTHFYKNALRSDNFDDLFVKDPDEVFEIVSKLSDGQKRSVAFRAKKLIESEQIDSIKVITALEKALSIELIER